MYGCFVGIIIILRLYFIFSITYKKMGQTFGSGRGIFFAAAVSRLLKISIFEFHENMTIITRLLTYM